jgi:hypothetical protein
MRIQAHARKIKRLRSLTGERYGLSGWGPLAGGVRRIETVSWGKNGFRSLWVLFGAELRSAKDVLQLDQQEDIQHQRNRQENDPYNCEDIDAVADGAKIFH